MIVFYFYYLSVRKYVSIFPTSFFLDFFYCKSWTIKMYWKFTEKYFYILRNFEKKNVALIATFWIMIARNIHFLDVLNAIFTYYVSKLFKNLKFYFLSINITFYTHMRVNFSRKCKLISCFLNNCFCFSFIFYCIALLNRIIDRTD